MFMRSTKRFTALLLSLLLLVSLALTACSDKNPGDELSAEAAYKVTVVDGLGNPYTEKIIVKLMQGGKQVAMGAINAQGVFEKTLSRGEYTVEVASTNADLKCNFIPVTLTAEVTEAQVIMAYAPTDFREISANSVSTGEYLTYQAGTVGTGSSYIKLDAADRTYVLFTPTEAGIYEFSVSNDDASVGYYGAPHFVQSYNLAEMDGKKFTMSVSASMISAGTTGTTVIVVGLDAAEGKEGCILNIKRIGDPAWSVEEEPWNNYRPKKPIEKFTLEDGVKLVPFDVTASTDTYKLVLNEQDGTYRLGSVDGPKVYVRVANAVYGVNMKEMVGEIVYDADGVLMQTGTAPFRYMYDNGKDDFFKEDYTDSMRQYVTAADKATGAYPLNEDLYYMLPLGIENKGWTREGTINYLFNGVVGLNNEIAWMFLLCHEEGDISAPPVNPDPDDDKPVNPDNPDDPTPSGPIEDNKDAPIVIGSTLTFEAEVKANHIVYFDLMKVNDTILTIKSKDAYVIYNGKKYEAKNGVVTVPNLYSQHTNIPVSIQIGNKGTKDTKFVVTLSYPEGHRENPYQLSTGALTTKQKSGDFDGLYYTYTAPTAGTLTFKVDSVTKGTYAGISITRVVDGIPVMVSLEAGSSEVSVELNAGETIQINICATTDILGTYPMSTIKTTVSFA
jgi:hypothetical protein